MTRKSVLLLMLGWYGALVPVTAAAELPKQVTISWHAPLTCPRPASLEADVANRLGSESIDPGATAIAVVVEPHQPEPYELTLTIAGSRAERRVQLRTCGEVGQAAALLIATALAPAHEVSEADAQETAREPRAALRWSARLGALFDVRSLPGPSAGPLLGVELGRAQIRLWVDARYLAPRVFKDANSGPRAGVDLMSLALGGAYAWPLGPFSLGPCVEAELGAQRARARGARAAGSTFGPWASAWLGFTGEYTGFRAFALSLTAALGTPLWRSEYTLTDPGSPFKTEGLLFRMQAGIRFAFGAEKALAAKNPGEGGQ